ncbi:MAG: cache domain-containing protein [Bacteroidota bacterium]|jgi:two-component system NtrC family sensor kinase
MKRLSAKSIQSQLILYFTIAILVPAIITSTVGMKLIYNQIISRAETKSLSDLNSAREIYRNKITQIESVTRLTAARSLIISAVSERNNDFLRKDLEKTLRREKLDVLTVVDKNGNVICRGRNPGLSGDNLIGDKFIAHAVRSRQIVSGTDIVSKERLLQESPDLAAQALMDVTPTPKAKPRENRQETSGMMLKTAVPIFDDENNFQGVMLGGILLNRNFEIVDKIKEIVHEKEIYKGREIGTATIFQNDLRISTNVKNQDGTRAITTLVSEEVYDAVLNRGERFVGDAFVVNAWYIAAYEPIRDVDNTIIGILYVGVLKQPFDDVLRNTLITFLGIALGGIILIVLVSIQLAKRISRPLKKLEETANKIADGEYRHDFTVHAPSEIEHLASSLSKMAKDLEAEKRELEEWGSTLEKKVEQRTEEIKKIHSQMFRSEKLASLGKLAAGVAHEINNPLTGILTNSSLLLEDLAADDPRREDVEVMVKETIRCREIVKRLLDFAKQSKPQKKLTDINSLIENIVLLVRNQTSFRNIRIDKDLTADIPGIQADADQVQQVFINIVLNAAEAMTKGGMLTITSRLSRSKDFIEIIFKDNGPGIPESVKEKIFDPFFTTKEHGTGLGLSISYGIIEQHGGTISVESTPGEGSVFTIELPIKPTDSEEK